MHCPLLSVLLSHINRTFRTHPFYIRLPRVRVACARRGRGQAHTGCSLAVRACAYKCGYLIAGGHDGDHGELVNADLGDPHCGQEADLRGAHVGALGQHTLAAPDVMTYWPISAQTCDRGGWWVIQMLFLEQWQDHLFASRKNKNSTR